MRTFLRYTYTVIKVYYKSRPKEFKKLNKEIKEKPLNLIMFFNRIDQFLLFYASNTVL